MEGPERVSFTSTAQDCWGPSLLPFGKLEKLQPSTRLFLNSSHSRRSKKLLISAAGGVGRISAGATALLWSHGTWGWGVTWWLGVNVASSVGKPTGFLKRRDTKSCSHYVTNHIVFSIVPHFWALSEHLWAMPFIQGTSARALLPNRKAWCFHICRASHDLGKTGILICLHIPHSNRIKTLRTMALDPIQVHDALMKGYDNVNRIKRCFICVWELLSIAPLSPVPHHPLRSFRGRCCKAITTTTTTKPLLHTERMARKWFMTLTWRKLICFPVSFLSILPA